MSFQAQTILDLHQQLKKNQDSKELILKTLDEGDYFGVLSLFGKTNRASYVEAMTKSELLMFNKDIFIEMIHKNPVIAINLLGEVCNRLAATNKQIGSIVFTDVKQGKIFIELLV